jgi:hypothetical protein
MARYLMGGLLATLLVCQPASAAPQAPKPTAKDAPKEMRLNGCISRDRVTPGQFNFLDNETGGRYRLTGKNLKKFVGRRVEILGGPPGRRVTFRTGLWPSPNVAAQAGAMDPAEAAIANLPGGAADAVGVSPLPEFHVSQLRGVEGACE